MMEVVADRDVWQLNPDLLPSQPQGHERVPKKVKKERMEKTLTVRSHSFRQQEVLVTRDYS